MVLSELTGQQQHPHQARTRTSSRGWSGPTTSKWRANWTCRYSRRTRNWRQFTGPKAGPSASSRWQRSIRPRAPMTSTRRARPSTPSLGTPLLPRPLPRNPPKPYLLKPKPSSRKVPRFPSFLFPDSSSDFSSDFPRLSPEFP
eukprot:2908260-Rhodomonas_salina.1